MASARSLPKVGQSVIFPTFQTSTLFCEARPLAFLFYAVRYSRCSIEAWASAVIGSAWQQQARFLGHVKCGYCLVSSLLLRLKVGFIAVSLSTQKVWLLRGWWARPSVEKGSCQKDGLWTVPAAPLYPKTLPLQRASQEGGGQDALAENKLVIAHSSPHSSHARLASISV